MPEPANDLYPLSKTFQVTPGGGQSQLINALNVLPSTLMYTNMIFTSPGNGSICFRYANATEPSQTGGWRVIGSWNVSQVATATTVAPSTTGIGTTVAPTTSPSSISLRLTISINCELQRAE
jgi:hypothetical protein